MQDVNSDIQKLINAKLDRAIDEQGAQALSDWIAADARHAKEYARQAAVHSQLFQAHGASLGAQKVDTAHATLVELIESAETPLGEFSPQQPAPHLARPGSPTARRVSLAVAAVVLLAAGLTAFVTFQRDITSSSLALLVRSQDAEWAGKSRPRNGQMLPGGKLHLVKGAALLRFDSGVEVVIQGPTRFETKDNGMELAVGSIVATVPNQGRGFTVRSPHMDIVDLGTEFSLRVEENGISEVHVSDGEVEAHIKNAAGRKVSSETLTRRQARRLESPESGAQPIAYAPDQFVRYVDEYPPLHVTDEYVQSVTQHGPRLYLRFDDDRQLRNNAAPDEFTQVTGKYELGGRPTNRFAVFRPEHEPLELAHELNLEGNIYTIELWVHPPSRHRGALVHIGNRADQGHGYGALVELIGAKKSKPHKPSSVRFSHRHLVKGRHFGHGGHLYSDQPYASNRWQHIVAVKNANEMNLYIDGVHCGRMAREIQLAIPRWITLGDHPTAAEDGISRRFVGAMDELAIYDRALTPTEIKQHFDFVFDR